MKRLLPAIVCVSLEQSRLSKRTNIGYPNSMRGTSIRGKMFGRSRSFVREAIGSFNLSPLNGRTMKTKHGYLLQPAYLARDRERRVHQAVGANGQPTDH